MTSSFQVFQGPVSQEFAVVNLGLDGYSLLHGLDTAVLVPDCLWVVVWVGRGWGAFGAFNRAAP